LNYSCCWGLALSEKQIPQVVEKIESWGKTMESLERGRVLAKQVLSQLSYTPTAGTCPDFKAFVTVRILRSITQYRPVFQNSQCF
jgi:hypothetical protein